MNRTTEVMCYVLERLQGVESCDFPSVDSTFYHSLVAYSTYAYSAYADRPLDADALRGVALAASVNWTQFQLLQELRQEGKTEPLPW